MKYIWEKRNVVDVVKEMDENQLTSIYTDFDWPQLNWSSDTKGTDNKQAENGLQSQSSENGKTAVWHYGLKLQWYLTGDSILNIASQQS